MDPKIEIFARNLEVTDRIKDYLTKKVSKLDRFLANIEDIRVDLAFEKAARSSSDRQVAQITLRGKGFILRTEERADDLFAAIDASVDKMQRQIKRLKGKREIGRGDGTPASEVAAVTPEVDEDETEGAVIVRRKKFTIAPMSEQEAIDQMTLLGHENFFVFYNADTSRMNVLYRRRDGNYGLIEPEIG